MAVTIRVAPQLSHITEFFVGIRSKGTLQYHEAVKAQISVTKLKTQLGALLQRGLHAQFVA